MRFDFMINMTVVHTQYGSGRVIYVNTDELSILVDFGRKIGKRMISLTTLNDRRLEFINGNIQLCAKKILSLLETHGNRMPSIKDGKYLSEYENCINIANHCAQAARTRHDSYNPYRAFRLMG